MKNVDAVSSDLVKPQIKLHDSNFAHAICCSNGNLKIYPQYFDWYRGSEERDIAVFVDGRYGEVVTSKAKVKILMLLEPPSVTPHLYFDVARHQKTWDLYDYILTFDKELVKLNPDKIKWYPLGGCWIEEVDRKIWPKTKNISIIASEKNFTEGHKLRHKLIQHHHGKIDVYGRGYRFVESKLEALKDYRYTIVIENCALNNYFSEKLIDAYMTGTIPIYWGSNKEVADMFQPAWMPIAHLDSILKNPVHMEDFYNGHLTSGGIQTNFDRAKEYVNTEDWLWLNFLKNLCTTTPKM